MRIDTTSGDFDYTYLSLGAGVQSSALLVLSCTDERVPKPDVAIFADTGDEPPWVYEYVDVLRAWAAREGVPVVTTGHKSGQSLGSYQGSSATRSFVPLFSLGANGAAGMTRRSCTREFKIEPIMQKVRREMGYKARQRVKHRVRAMLGITIDEAQRMKPAWHKWVTNTFPLVDLGLHRHDCYRIIDEAGLPEPQKSACVFCPYHSDAYWHWLKTERPEQFQKAVEFDRRNRYNTAAGTERPSYLHRSCEPLDAAEFITTDPNQTDMWGECEGMCGV